MSIIRQLGYVGGIQRLTMPAGYAATVTAYVWGGAGGGGGADSGGGGNGSGGACAVCTFEVAAGNWIDVVVGGGGGGGGTDTWGAGGGAAGTSFVGELPGLGVFGGTQPVAVDMLAIGGGGGGGGGSSRIIPYAGAGGGAGEIRSGSIVVNPGDVLSLSVAAGGSAGGPRDGPYSSGAPGGAGGTSFVVVNSDIIVLANGGGGGQQASLYFPNAGGAGGSGGTGYRPLVPVSGGTSAFNPYYAAVDGGTGGNAYTLAADAAGPYSYGTAGAGGIGNGNTPGQTGYQYGGGGGGGGMNQRFDSQGYIPAPGGSGLVLISYNTTNGVPLFSGGVITVVGLRVTHTFATANTNITSYSGGYGSNAGPVPYSGAGGGGGGASLVWLNNVLSAVAGGGGGGGGGGNSGGGISGRSAPGTRGQAAFATNGQDGQTKYGDGGGAGGGGGGYGSYPQGGGNGGSVNPGDSGGDAGFYGGSMSINGTTYNSSGRDPAYSGKYSVSTPTGGYGAIRGARSADNGGSGCVILEFVPRSIFVNNGTWHPVIQTYINSNNTWYPVKSQWVKKDNQWTNVLASGDQAPYPTFTGKALSVLTRPYPGDPPPPEPPPPPPPPDGGDGQAGPGIF